MRYLKAEDIQKAIFEGICRISYASDAKAVEKIRRAYEESGHELERDVLAAILENNETSAQDNIPLCQDTGTTVIIAEMGRELMIEGATLQEIADRAAAEAQGICPLRASIALDPLFGRKNSGNNSPAIVHSRQVDGDRLKLKIAQKGGGAENMSFLMMLSPATPLAKIKDEIVQRIVESGSRACPPLVVGIGIGGNFERCALLAKEALFEELGREHPDTNYARLESELLEMINEKGKGAQGMGGSLTALAVHIMHEPCHIASLPIAVNLQCHAHRHIEFEL